MGWGLSPLLCHHPSATPGAPMLRVSWNCALSVDRMKGAQPPGMVGSGQAPDGTGQEGQCPERSSRQHPCGSCQLLPLSPQATATEPSRSAFQVLSQTSRSSSSRRRRSCPCLHRSGAAPWTRWDVTEAIPLEAGNVAFTGTGALWTTDGGHRLNQQREDHGGAVGSKPGEREPQTPGGSRHMALPS